MYDTQYNRKIAKEIDDINKRFVKHNKDLEGGGFLKYLPLLLAGMGHQTGQQEYVKAKGGSKKQARMCPHCEGTGVSGSGVSGSGVSGSGVSGSGVSGSGFKMSIGFGKKRGRKPKAQAPTEEPPKDLDGGFGISFGFGKKRGRKPKQAPAPQQKDLDGGFGISFGFGKDGKKKKRGNPNISKRAEIVKQVMKEQGLGMIQASQYIKKNNLY
jgi:hypothetical protein